MSCKAPSIVEGVTLVLFRDDGVGPLFTNCLLRSFGFSVLLLQPAGKVSEWIYPLNNAVPESLGRG